MILPLIWIVSGAVAVAEPAAVQGAAVSAEPVQAAKLINDLPAIQKLVEERHPLAKRAEGDIAQAAGELGQTKAFQNPTFSFNAGTIKFGKANMLNSPVASTAGDTVNYTFNVSQPIEIGKRGLRIDASELEYKAAGERYNAVIRDLVADVRQRLGLVLHLAKKLKVTQEHLDSAREILRLGKVRFEHGDLSGYDLDRLDLESASIEREFARAKNELHEAEVACQAVVFAPCAADGAEATELAGTDPVPIGPASADVQASVATRPDIQSLREEEQAASLRSSLARRKLIPDPALSVGYVRDHFLAAGNQPKSLQAGISFEVPIFDRGSHQAEAETAKAVMFGSEADALTVEYSSRVQALTVKIAQLKTTLDTFRSVLVPKSESLVKIAVTAFERGEQSLTDLLAVRRQYGELRLEVQDTEYDLFSSENDLYRLVVPAGNAEGGNEKGGNEKGGAAPAQP